MSQYILLDKDHKILLRFQAPNLEAAERIVDEHFDEDDGEMHLYRLTHVCGWG